MKKYNIGWGLTNVCNMNCEFCYSKETRTSTNNLNFEDWKSFVNHNYNYVNSINFGTGENSIIDEFFDLIYYIRENFPHIKMALTTNGYIIERLEKSEHFLNIFKKCIDEVDVSLDFYDKEKHNEFRGQPMAYDWAVKTLRFLKENKIKSTIVFVGFDQTLTKENLDGLFKIAKENNAILRMNIYRPVSKNEIVNSKFILSYEALKNALIYIDQNYEIINLSDSLLGNVFTNKHNIKDLSGTKSIRILPNGDICPSTYLINKTFRNYNIKNNILLSNIKFSEFERPPLPLDCLGCKYQKLCKGGVFDRRILWYGTLKERDPYCPLRHENSLPDVKFNVSKIKRISVHDDYLPTLFFKNRI